MPRIDKPQLISLQTASKEYGPPYTSLIDWTKTGALPVVRVANTRRIWVRRADLDRLIEHSTTRADVTDAERRQVPPTPAPRVSGRPRRRAPAHRSK